MRNRLQWQLAFIGCAGVLVGAVAFLLIRDAMARAERAIVGETVRQLDQALGELGRECEGRMGAGPEAALREITAGVLRAYPGVEGGYFWGGELVGYAFPTHDVGGRKTDVPLAERPSIEETVRAASRTGVGSMLLRGAQELVVLRARRSGCGAVAWVMKRAPEEAGGSLRHNVLLGALTGLAMLSLGAALAAALRLHRGLAEVESGLRVLERDLSHRLPERGDEFGAACAAINRMAAARQRLEGELRREDRLRAMGRLVAKVAHEIRNPLNSMRLAIEVLERESRAGKAREEEFEAVKGEVDRLNRLVSDLLEFGRRPAGGPAVFDAAEAARQCIGMLEAEAAGKGVRIEAGGEERARAAGEPDRFRQALFNVVLNAVQASPAGEVVEVRVEREEEGIVVRVCDRGPGLSGEDEEHLFEAFHTGRDGGTGLGLAVSRELMAAIGGELRYEGSRPGAVFALRLPGAGKERVCPTTEEF